MDEVLEFLKNNPTYFIATVKDDGVDIRPFGTICKFEGKLYIQTGRVKDVYKQMVANPKIAINGWDPKTGTWLRITATAVEDTRLEAEEALLAEYPGLQSRYAAGDGNNVVFWLKDATARFCSFTADERVVTF